jgi:hypothetical protein
MKNKDERNSQKYEDGHSKSIEEAKKAESGRNMPGHIAEMKNKGGHGHSRRGQAFFGSRSPCKLVVNEEGCGNQRSIKITLTTPESVLIFQKKTGKLIRILNMLVEKYGRNIIPYPFTRQGVHISQTPGQNNEQHCYGNSLGSVQLKRQNYFPL